MSENNEFVAACRDGNLEEVKALIASGEDPNCTNSAGATGLELACSRGQKEIAIYLLQLGASPNRIADNNPHTTALIHAATKGFDELVDLLCKHNADVNAIDDGNGQSALMWASAYGRSNRVVEILLSNGADTELKDVYGNTAIQLATHFGFTEIADLIESADGSS